MLSEPVASEEVTELLRPDHKTNQNGRGLGHVTKFRNFGTPL